MRLRALLAASVAFCPPSSQASSAEAPTLATRQESALVDRAVFLRRAYHASAYLDGWLYIDGGEFSYLTSTGPRLQYSTSLLAVDLTKEFTAATVPIRNIGKPPDAPNVRNGGLWVDEANHVLYLGFAGGESFFGQACQPNGLWSFSPDRRGSGTWSSLNDTAPVEFQTVTRRWDGLTASGNGKGYFLGGYLVRPEAELWDLYPVRGMLVYDFASKVLTNTTMRAVSTAAGVQKGSMAFVPNFGRQGILVSIGGVQRGKTKANEDYILSMSTVQVYDAASDTWYDQLTTGSPPPPRKEYCVAGAASGNRTYELLVYAGWFGHLGPDSTPYDAAYVLSLPAFRWFKAEYPALRPRHGLTCNSIGGGKIVTVGGVDTVQNLNTAPYGVYGHVFDSPDPFKFGLGIFDLSTMAFVESHRPTNQSGYVLNAEIRSHYDRNGRLPTYDSTGLADVMAVQNFPPGSAGSSSSPPDVAAAPASSNIGAIVGGAVGGAAFVAVVTGLIVFLLRRRKRGGAYRIPDAAAYMHVAEDGSPKSEAPYDPISPMPPPMPPAPPIPDRQHEPPSMAPIILPPMPPLDLPSHNIASSYYAPGGGVWPRAHYGADGGDDQLSISSDSKFDGPITRHSQQSYEMQMPFRHDVSEQSSWSNLRQPLNDSTSEIYEVQAFHDAGAATHDEDNYKYNVRF